MIVECHGLQQSWDVQQVQRLKVCNEPIEWFEIAHFSEQTRKKSYWWKIILTMFSKLAQNVRETFHIPRGTLRPGGRNVKHWTNTRLMESGSHCSGSKQKKLASPG